MQRAFLILTILFVVFVIVICTALTLGSEKLPFFEILSAFFRRGRLNEQQSAILWEIRLPRFLLGACVGAALALAGAS